MHFLAQMKHIRPRIRHFPFLREVRREAELVVALQQIVEQQVINVFRLRVRADARVQVHRHGLN